MSRWSERGSGLTWRRTKGSFEQRARAETTIKLKASAAKTASAAGGIESEMPALDELINGLYQVEGINPRDINALRDEVRSLITIREMEAIRNVAALIHSFSNDVDAQPTEGLEAGYLSGLNDGIAALAQTINSAAESVSWLVDNSSRGRGLPTGPIVLNALTGAFVALKTAMLSPSCAPARRAPFAEGSSRLANSQSAADDNVAGVIPSMAYATSTAADWRPVLRAIDSFGAIKEVVNVCDVAGLRAKIPRGGVAVTSEVSRVDRGDGKRGQLYTWHLPVIPLTVPATVMNSSRRSVLYVDKSMRWRAYRRLLRALWKADLVSTEDYRYACEAGFTAVKAPWS